MDRTRDICKKHIKNYFEIVFKKSCRASPSCKNLLHLLVFMSTTEFNKELPYFKNAIQESCIYFTIRKFLLSHAFYTIDEFLDCNVSDVTEL